MHTCEPQTPWNETRVTSTLEVGYPIIQGPLGGFSSQQLTATVSSFGGSWLLRSAWTASGGYC